MNKTTEALKSIRAILAEPDDEETISKIREALSKPVKQEPVAEVVYQTATDSYGTSRLDSKTIVPYKPISELAVGTKLYRYPVRTKDLTDDEIMKINVDTAGIVPTCDRQFHFARAVIAAYKEKQKC